MRSLLLAALLMLVIAPIYGQTITLGTPASSEEMLHWLRSGDPRLIAWAATLAREHNDQAALDAMVDMMDRWTEPASIGTAGGQDRAMFAVLDALIQRHITVSVDGLHTLAPSFPGQAVILAAQLPRSDTVPLFLEWYQQPYPLTQIEKTPESRGLTFLGRMAAVLLAMKPPPGFAALVIDESVARLEFDVYSPNHSGGSGMGPVCGDGIGSDPPKEWPEVFVYGVQEEQSSVGMTLLTSSGGLNLYYQRTPAPNPAGGCYSVETSAHLRQRLLAAMLGIHINDMDWRAEQTISLQWKNAATLRREIQNATSKERHALDRTVSELEAKDYLTREEARTVRTKLMVVVRDLRQDKKTAAPLPSITLSGPHLTLRQE